MKEYHKIQTVFKRDPKTKFKTLIRGEYSEPEFDLLSECQWDFTEKVDGTNIRVMRDAFGIRFAGKTDRASIPPQLLLNLTGTFTDDLLRGVFPDPEAELCLYGEGFGAKIQKAGKLYRPDQGFVLFDVRVGDVWLARESVVDIAGKLGIEVVPLIGVGQLDEMVERVREGFPSQWGHFMAEGIVARPSVELRTRLGKRIITKIKHKDFSKEES